MVATLRETNITLLCVVVEIIHFYLYVLVVCIYTIRLILMGLGARVFVIVVALLLHFFYLIQFFSLPFICLCHHHYQHIVDNNSGSSSTTATNICAKDKFAVYVGVLSPKVKPNGDVISQYELLMRKVKNYVRLIYLTQNFTCNYRMTV